MKNLQLFIFVFLSNGVLMYHSTHAWPTIFTSNTRTMIKESGKITTKETANTEKFTKIKATGNISIVLTQSAYPQYAIKISADENIIPYLEWSIYNQQLYVGIKENVSLCTTQPIIFYITLQEIQQLSLDQNVHLKSNNTLVTKQLEISLTGFSNLTASINVNNLIINSSDSGSINLSGTAENQQIYLSGAREYNANTLNTDNTYIQQNGSSRSSVHANKILSFIINGASSLEYTGNPSMSGSTFDAGTVRKKNNWFSWS